MSMNPYVPDAVHPTPPGSTSPHILQLIPTVSTPTVLGLSSVRMKGIQFRGEKAASTANTGDVTLQLLNGSTWQDLAVLSAGGSWEWPVSYTESIGADKFRVTTGTAGDGVRVVYHQPF